jgi:hypothetical protein
MLNLSSIAMLPTAFRHQVWGYEESLRSAFGRDQMGFPRRPTPAAAIARVEQRTTGVKLQGKPWRYSRSAGLIGSPNGSAIAHASAHFGIDLEVGDQATAVMFSMGFDSRWPLVTLAARSDLTPDAASVLRYLQTGGTIFIPELSPADNSWLDGLAAGLQVDLPRCRALPRPAAHITFSGSRSDITAEMAGLTVENCEGYCFLDRCARSEAITWMQVGTDALSAVVEVPVHGGRVILAVGPQPPPGNLYDFFQPEQALSVLPAMLVVRQVYGDAAWRAPYAMANFTIDDPLLRQGFLGLDYRRALMAAREDNFHLTVATVPRELPLAEAATLSVLADNHDRVTACYHGNEHDGYEFFVSDDGRSRFRSRPISVQLTAVGQAAARGRSFAQRTGHALDRVMVFPHGVGPAAVLGELGRHGFLATSNWLDRYPLGSPRPPDADLGMRPADVAWDGFPLLWRRPLDDETFAFDLLIGRPVLYFTHRKQAGANFEPLRALAGRINEVAPGSVRWRGLEEIARHAYAVRRKPASQKWEVLMTSNLACLHNDDGDTRRYRVHRRHLPRGARLEAAGVSSAGPEIEVEVLPGQTVIVQVAGADINDLPDPLSGRPCSVSTGVDS